MRRMARPASSVEPAPSRRRRILLVIAWLAFAVLLLGSPHFYAATFSTPYIAALLCGIAYLHWTLWPRANAAAGMLIGGGLLCFWDFAVRGWSANASGVVSLFGFASMILLGLRALFAREVASPSTRRLYYAFAGALLFFFSDWLATTFLTISNGLHTSLLDPFLLSFDASLRVLLSFDLGAAFERWAWLRSASLAFYFAIAFVGAVIFAAHLKRDLRRALEVGIGFLLAGPVGVLFYNFFPAIGPAHAFTSLYPSRPPALSQVRNWTLMPTTGHGIINAMPSLHLTWVLLAWWFSRGLGWPYRALAALFLAFTILATLGSGEHYIADLVVAFPFALMIEAIASVARSPVQRARPALVGLGLTICWLLLLRHATAIFWLSPAIPWLLAAATITFTIRESQRFDAGSAAPQGNNLGRRVQAEAAARQ